MNKTFRLRLFWKLGLSFLLLLLLALGAVYLYTASIWEESLPGFIYQRMDALLQLAESQPPDLEDREALLAWVEWIGRSGTRVTLIASDGTVLADSEENPVLTTKLGDRPEVRAAFATGHAREGRIGESNFLYLAARVPWGPDPPVVLRLAQEIEPARREMADIRTPLATVSIAVLVVGGLISLVVSRDFSNRIEKLKAFSRRVSEGDFSPSLVVPGQDELAQLQSSLNQTVERLAHSVHLLEKEKNQSAAILATMSEGLAVVDPEQRILYSNQAFQRALQPEGDPLSEGRRLIEVTRLGEILEMVQDVLRDGQQREASILAGGSTARHFLVRVESLQETGAVLVVLDITEIRRLERARTDFVANVSHELRTPLTAIQGFAETLLQGAVEDPKHNRRFVEILRDHAIRLARLSEDLLKLSRIEEGKLGLELGPVAVGKVITQCCETVRLKLIEKRLHLTVESEEPTLYARADCDALGDVLRNLLDNAVQYTPREGHVTVRASEASGRVRIAVADDGIGIPFTSHDRVFERFYRVDPARSREVGGTGLGLSISKHLVESMGGEISLTSEVGKGSTFVVELPATDPHVTKA